MLFPKQQIIEAFALTQLEVLIHFDRFERANFDANLAAHANRDVDVEYCRVKLRFSYVIRFLILALNNIDALRRAFFLANLAGHTAQTSFRILGVINKDWKIAVILRQRTSFFRILYCNQAVLPEITSDEI